MPEKGPKYVRRKMSIGTFFALLDNFLAPFFAFCEGFRAEVEIGITYLRRLLEIVEPAQLLCLGRVAASALGEDVPVVRHPANGGASLCTRGLRELLSAWLPS